MLGLILSILAAIRVSFRGRTAAAVEVLALRQQLAVMKRKRPRPPLTRLDRLFWLMLRRLWSGWAELLVIVKPETVVRWHRAGFRLYWRAPARRVADRRLNARFVVRCSGSRQRTPVGALPESTVRLGSWATSFPNALLLGI